MQSTPLISIIVPCYNSRDFVTRTLDSVRAQTFANWECVIVDDGSTDDSAAQVEAHIADEPRMKLVRQPNGGVCNARNRGFQECSPDSRFLLFLDADDLIAPEMLQQMSLYLEENSQVGLLHCAFVRVDPDDEVCDESSGVTRLVPLFRGGWGVRELPEDVVETPFISLFAMAMVLPSASLLRREIYEQTDGWDEELGQHGEERDLFLEMALISPVHYMGCPFLKYRVHPAQSTLQRAGDGKDYVSNWYDKCRRQARSSWSQAQAMRYREGWLFVEATVVPKGRVAAARQSWRERRRLQTLKHYLWAILRCLQIRFSKCPF